MLVSRIPLHLLLTVLAAVPIGVGQRNNNMLVSKQQAPTLNPEASTPCFSWEHYLIPLPPPKGPLHLHPEPGKLAACEVTELGSCPFWASPTLLHWESSSSRVFLSAEASTLQLTLPLIQRTPTCLHLGLSPLPPGSR